MKVEVVDNREVHRFEAYADEELAGFIDYRIHPGQISLIHTQVEDAFEGKGIASTLVKCALGMVAEAGLAMLPICPFVKAYVQRHREYVDLVPVQQRGRFDLLEQPGSV